MKTSKLKDLAKEVITEANGRQTLTKDNFDSRLNKFMNKNIGKGSFDKSTTPDMPEATFNYETKKSFRSRIWCT